MEDLDLSTARAIGGIGRGFRHWNLIAVASLRLVSPGVATDGVSLFFFLKKVTTLLVIIFSKVMNFFSHHHHSHSLCLPSDRLSSS